MEDTETKYGASIDPHRQNVLFQKLQISLCYRNKMVEREKYIKRNLDWEIVYGKLEENNKLSKCFMSMSL